jgi:hypothetical protein
MPALLLGLWLFFYLFLHFFLLFLSLCCLHSCLFFSYLRCVVKIRRVDLLQSIFLLLVYLIIILGENGNVAGLSVLVLDKTFYRVFVSEEKGIARLDFGLAVHNIWRTHLYIFLEYCLLWDCL